MTMRRDWTARSLSVRMRSPSDAFIRQLGWSLR